MFCSLHFQFLESSGPLLIPLYSLWTQLSSSPHIPPPPRLATQPHADLVTSPAPRQPLAYQDSTRLVRAQQF